MDKGIDSIIGLLMYEINWKLIFILILIYEIKDRK